MTALLTLAALAGAAPEDIRDIRGPIAHAAGHPGWIWAACVGAGLAVAALAFVLLRRRKPVPAHVVALRALEAARPLIDTQQCIAFSVEVSDAVRGYVEAAFRVRAPRRTTDELLADLMNDESPVAAHRAELGQFLGFCDLAKYARWSLSPADMAGMLSSAEAFVRATVKPSQEVRA